MGGGRYDPGVTEPSWPALSLERLEAVVVVAGLGELTLEAVVADRGRP